MTKLKSQFPGAIFREDQRNSYYDLAFKYAVHKINRDQRILPKTTLLYDIQYVAKGDSFHANKQGNKQQQQQVCKKKSFRRQPDST